MSNDTVRMCRYQGRPGCGLKADARFREPLCLECAALLGVRAPVAVYVRIGGVERVDTGSGRQVFESAGEIA